MTTYGPFDNPALMLGGEIEFSDDTKLLVPPVVKFQEWKLSDAYVNVTADIPPVEAWANYWKNEPPTPVRDDGLSWTGVMDAFSEGPENDAEGHNHVPRVPVGAIVMVALGLALMGIGFVMNEPVSWWVYGVLHG